MKKNLKYCLFILGPTASGKTDLSLNLASAISTHLKIDSEIINADVGQFYSPLKIGTAKPDWQHMPIKHYLFDILDMPEDLDVVTYRRLVSEQLESAFQRSTLQRTVVPIIVGGSLFYIQSLFFPPLKLAPIDQLVIDDSSLLPWDRLNKIDPVRAKAIHPNDTYRIERALEIWKTYGKKPSECGPIYDPLCNLSNYRIIFINRSQEELYNQISLRTEAMIKNGWIEEAKALKNTEWEEFLKKKKLIGYPEIFKWIDDGQIQEQIPELTELIKKKTRNYAKRQITFWKKFRKLLECKASNIEIINSVASSVDNKEIKGILEHICVDLESIY